MDGTLDEVEFLVSSSHRVTVLNSLHDSPRTRTELRSLTGASSPTMSRILSDFEDRDWIERTGQTYRLTGPGQFVATNFDAFMDAIALERQLREVWEWLPLELDGFDVGLFTDVTITRPNPGYPNEPIERRIELITGTSTWRGVGVAMLGLPTLETSFDRFLDSEDELYCEYIYPPDVFEELQSWGDDETIMEAVSSESYTVFLHDDLPFDDRFEICIFDDRVTLCCYDDETGALQALVETTSPEMWSWADGYYERLRTEAVPLDDAIEDGALSSRRDSASP